MNDEPLDDEEQDTHIRALLAELGSGPDGEPMPPEVAARLDDTLARLLAERVHVGVDDSDPEQSSGRVVPLRRAWLHRATAAAAAVVVLGAGGVAAAHLGVFGGDSLTTADSGASSSDAAGSQTAPSAGATSPASDGADSQDGFQAVTLPRLSSASFAADVDRLLGSRRLQLSTPEKAAPQAGGAEKSPGDDTRAGTSALRSRGCTGPQISDGAVPHPVRYDGQVAVLVVHPVRAGHRLVEAWSCSGRRRLAETTLTP